MLKNVAFALVSTFALLNVTKAQDLIIPSRRIDTATDAQVITLSALANHHTQGEEIVAGVDNDVTFAIESATAGMLKGEWHAGLCAIELQHHSERTVLFAVGKRRRIDRKPFSQVEHYYWRPEFDHEC